MTFSVAIVGRPNVGKSTLFNRLVGRRIAIVDDRQGVTRDRREGQARLVDLSFRVVDTAGYDYMRAMCEGIRYEVLDTLAALPSRLPRLYRALTS
jgi:small GTP-binding protein